MTFREDIAKTLESARKRIDAMSPLVLASVRYHDCLVEFGDDRDAAGICAEHGGVWFDAVQAYRGRPMNVRSER